MKTSKNDGFSLIELTIVMVIVGVLIAGFFSYLNVEMAKRKLEESNNVVANNSEILATFSSNYDGADANTLADQRLPCPSNPNIPIGNPDFGVEQCPSLTAPDGSIFNGVRVAVDGAGNRVFIGAFPTATLETKGDYAFDGYNSPLVYAVSSNLTVDGSVTNKNPVGFITVNVDGGVKNNAPFVIVSTGRITAGTTGSGATGDRENTNNDTVFNAYTGHTTRENAGYFDDEVSFELGKVATEYCVPDRVDVQEFTANGTWTKPNGILYAEIEISGADGGPGNCGGSPAGTCSAAGGDGGYAKKLYKADQLNDTESVVVGSGGRGDCTGNNQYGSPSMASLTGCSSVGGGNIMYYSHSSRYAPGSAASATSFKGISLTGGQGATATASGTVEGIRGTASGADYFTTSGMSLGYINSQAPTSFSFTKHSGSPHYNDYHFSGAYGGTGAGGFVMVTSYVCD